MTSGYTDIYGDIYEGGTPVVTVAGSASFAFPLTATGIPDPATLSLPVPVTNVAGDWMFAIISWHQPLGSPAVTWSVADDATVTAAQGHNWWDPLGAPAGTSSASGVTRTAVWYAPAARTCSNVWIAPTGFYLSVACTVLDVAGLQPWVTVTGLNTAFTNSGSSLGALALGAPASSAFLITACSSDLNTDTISLAGSGWATVPQIQVSNGTNHTSDLSQNAAWQITSSSSSATWTSSGSQQLSGLIGGVLVSAAMPAQPQRYWPATIVEVAPGSGIGTAADQVAWSPATARSFSLDVTQGRQYELAQLSTGEGTAVLDNPDSALLPPGTGAFAGITSGTPYRLRAAWPGGAWQVQFSGNGSTASPQISTGSIFSGSAGNTYPASLWLACSPPWASGVSLIMNFRTSGGAFISSAASASVTGMVATIASVSGVAPAATALIELVIAAAGTPPAGTIFYAAAAPF